MRPAGEVHLALLQAAHAHRRENAATGQGATLLELVHRSQVGYAVARALVPKLKSHGHLQIVGQRRVAYRNRPVAEYAPPQVTGSLEADRSVDLSNCMRSWTR